MRTPLIVLTLIAGLFFGACSNKNRRPSEYTKAENGYLDLSNWDFETYGSLELSGDWAFFWEGQLEILPTGEFTSFQNVPGTWNTPTLQE